MKTIFFIAAFISFNTIKAQQLNTAKAYADTTIKMPELQVSKNLNKVSEKKRLITSLIIPGGLVTYGFIALGNNGLKNLDKTVQQQIRTAQPTFNTRLDNYLQYAPAVAVYGLNAFGVKGKNNFRDRTIIYGMSTVFSTAFSLSFKYSLKVQRPDSSAFNSFPSGHTTTAFAAAEFLRMEYKDVSPWYGIAGYTVAAATGVLRLYNNKHWLSDVVAGAGFGILSTKFAYLIYPAIKRKFFKNKPMNTMVMPYYQRGGAGLALIYNFRH